VLVLHPQWDSLSHNEGLTLCSLKQDGGNAVAMEPIDVADVVPC